MGGFGHKIKAAILSLLVAAATVGSVLVFLPRDGGFYLSEAVVRSPKGKSAAEGRGLLLRAELLKSAAVRLARRNCATQGSARAGEIYRTLGLAERAESSFLRTLKFDPAGRFAARSLNEAGHIHRRKKEYEKAIAFYGRTIKECPGARGACGDAVTWTGKVYLKMKEGEKGRQTLIGFAERFPEFPVAAIRNMDLAARSLIDEGRYDEAGMVIESCKARFEALVREKKYKERMAGMIERALGNMKSPERLESLLSRTGEKAEGSAKGEIAREEAGTSATAAESAPSSSGGDS